MSSPLPSFNQSQVVYASNELQKLQTENWNTEKMALETFLVHPHILVKFQGQTLKQYRLAH